jgi:hypothetical protein
MVPPLVVSCRKVCRDWTRTRKATPNPQQPMITSFLPACHSGSCYKRYRHSEQPSCAIVAPIVPSASPPVKGSLWPPRALATIGGTSLFATSAPAGNVEVVLADERHVGTRATQASQARETSRAILRSNRPVPQYWPCRSSDGRTGLEDLWRALTLSVTRLTTTDSGSFGVPTFPRFW